MNEQEYNDVCQKTTKREMSVLKNQGSIDFSQGKVWRHMLNQSLPLLLAQMVQLLYNVVDRIYLGHLKGVGDMVLTGVGLVFPIITLIMAFTSMFGTGATPLFSIARGQGNEEEAEHILGHAACLLLISGSILMILIYFFRVPLLYAVGASQESLPYGDAYLRYYLIGTIPVMLTSGLNSFINAQGFPKIGMTTIMVGAVLNLVLDPIFIFYMQMGVSGAAVATVISQTIACIWVLRFFHGRKTAYRIRLRYMKLEWERTLKIITLGLAAFIVQGTNLATQVACNRMLRIYGGDLYIAVMTVLMSIREILSLPANALGEGTKPITGYNFGARKIGKVKECIKIMTLIGIGYLMFAWVAAMVFSRQFLGLFTNSEEMIQAGTGALHIYFFGFCFMGLQYAGQSTNVSLGLAKQSIFFSMFRKIIIVVPLTLILPHWFGVNGVFLAEPISNLVGGSACYATMYLTVYRRLESLAEHQNKV